MEPTIKEWALARIDENASKYNWQNLPNGWERKRVEWVYQEYLKTSFNKRAIKARIAASKASTFAELRSIVQAA